MPPRKSPGGISRRGSDILYYDTLVILSVSIVACGYVVFQTLAHIRRQSVTAATRSDRSVARCLDFIVLVLLGVELIQSINWLVGTILSQQIFFTTPDPATKAVLVRGCQVVGFWTYYTDIVIYCWNAAIAYR
jgi:hypothetical protein